MTEATASVGVSEGTRAPAQQMDESCLEFLIRERTISNAVVFAGLIAVIGVAFSIFHLYAAYFGQAQSYLHRTMHVTLMVVLCILLKPTGRKSWKDPINGCLAYDILCIHLGTPPTTVDWQWKDKDGVFTRAGKMTPLEFADKYLPTPIDDYVSLVHDPRASSPIGATFTVDYLGNVVDAPPIKYLNIEELCN